MAEQNVYRCKVSEPKNVIVVYEIRAASQEEADRIAEEKYHKTFPLKQKVIKPSERQPAVVNGNGVQNNNK